MNINALNEDNLWFIKNVPVAGAKLINSLGEGRFLSSRSLYLFFRPFLQFYVRSLESRLFKSTSSFQNFTALMEMHTSTNLHTAERCFIVLGFVPQAGLFDSRNQITKENGLKMTVSSVFVGE